MPAVTFSRVDDDQLAYMLKSGAVGVLPTDTVYGIVCRASDPVAVDKLFRVKPRDHKPGTVIAASIDQLVELGLHRRYLTAVQQYWPAPLSVVVPCANSALEYLHRGMQSLAVRIPASPALQTLLATTGPLMTSSANMPGHETASTVAEAVGFFADTVDFYVDGGDMRNRPASTVIRIVDDAIEILRPGAVTIDENGRINP